jgi:7,8-dihydro-6-hydroxymethylpterin dimethyltransferase
MEKAYQNETESLCPVCFKRIKAKRLFRSDEVFLVKECEEHGSFKTVIWRGEPSMVEWRRPKDPVHPYLCYGTAEKGCPFDCGLCEVHAQLPCSVLLEVTNRCNLNCAVCFADSGRGEAKDPSLEKITWLLERATAAVGPSNLQLSGGEPTLRDDLPEIVEVARRIGYSFIQVNTNGLRLASDWAYVRRLLDTGLSSVFLQFDGVDDEVYRSLRGRALLDQKLQAVKNCGETGLGVVLVPTLVRGVNTGSVGAIVGQALELGPTVRGVHFQPVSYFGRFPGQSSDEGRFTLPELMRCIEEQTGGLIKVTDLSPPGCEHAHCSFHASYVHSAEGRLRPIGTAKGDSCCSADIGAGGVRRTVETVSRRWTLPSAAPFSRSATLDKETPCCSGSSPDVTRVEDPLDLDVFLQEVATRSFTLSAMAFQDADNLDLERLRGCCISVVSPDGKLVPFCAYNLTSREGKSLYRGRNGSGA